MTDKKKRRRDQIVGEAYSKLIDVTNQVIERVTWITPLTAHNALKDVEHLVLAGVRNIVDILAEEQSGIRDLMLRAVKTEDIVAYDLVVCALFMATRAADDITAQIFTSNPDSMIEDELPMSIRLIPCWYDDGKVVCGTPMDPVYLDKS